MRKIALFLVLAYLVPTAASSQVTFANVENYYVGTFQISPVECVSLVVGLEASALTTDGLASFRLLFNDGAGLEIGGYENSRLRVGGFETVAMCIDDGVLFANEREVGDVSSDTNGRVSFLVLMQLAPRIFDRATGLEVPIPQSTIVRAPAVLFDKQTGETKMAFSGDSPLRLFKAPPGGAFP